MTEKNEYYGALEGNPGNEDSADKVKESVDDCAAREREDEHGIGTFRGCSITIGRDNSANS
jgi:hypothetical protein